MQLNLRNPLVFFDLETTGIDIVHDRIVEISMVKVMPNGDEIVKTRRINPGMPIPPESTAIHGITDDDVKDCPTFKEIAKSLAAQIEGCDLAGFNSNRFDIPMLAEEFLRAGVDVNLGRRKFVDVQTIFHKKEQRNLTAARLVGEDRHALQRSQEREAIDNHLIGILLRNHDVVVGITALHKSTDHFEVGATHIGIVVVKLQADHALLLRQEVLQERSRLFRQDK